MKIDTHTTVSSFSMLWTKTRSIQFSFNFVPSDVSLSEVVGTLDVLERKREVHAFSLYTIVGRRRGGSSQALQWKGHPMFEHPVSGPGSSPTAVFTSFTLGVKHEWWNC